MKGTCVVDEALLALRHHLVDIAARTVFTVLVHEGGTVRDAVPEGQLVEAAVRGLCLWR